MSKIFSKRKTFDDHYGRHALTEPGGTGDVLLMLPQRPAGLHPSRVRDDYQPRHSNGRVTLINGARISESALARHYREVFGQ